MKIKTKHRRLTPYDFRRCSLSYRSRELLTAPSVRFEARRLSRGFVSAVAVSVLPTVESTAGRKHHLAKLDHVAQLLAAALSAEQAGKVLALGRGKHNLLTTTADELVWHGYMDKATGNRRAKLVTRYRLLPKGRQALARFASWTQVYDPLRERPVVLRDREGNERKLPNTTPIGIRHAAFRLVKLNQFNLNDCDWRYEYGGKSRKLSTCVRAVYKPDFDHGGRMYSFGADGYQNLSRKVRKTITVDGERTAELDYSGFQPRVLYHIEGHAMPGDVYQAEAIFPAAYECTFMEDDRRLNGFDEDEVRAASRTLAKKALNIMLNASTESSARRAIGKVVSGWRMKDGQRERSGRQARLFATVVKAVCGTDVGGIVEATKCVHQPIAHRFFTGIGTHIMAVVDGPLMRDILTELMKQTRNQSRIVHSYIRSIFDVPLLKGEVVQETASGFVLRNGVHIEILTGDHRSIRGFTLLALVCDEAAFFAISEESRIKSDTELVRAVTPGLATTGGRLVAISSPYARKGWCWRTYEKCMGNDAATTLCWNAASRTMNSTLPQSVVDEAMADDLQAAKSEYGGAFREDVAEFLPLTLIQGLVVKGRIELLAREKERYSAFADVSGGRNDDAALAIAHREGRKVVIDLLRRYRPPHSPHEVIVSMAGELRRYGIRRITGDNYAAEFVSQAFKGTGIQYEKSAKVKSALYLELLPRLCSGEIELPDNQVLVSQLAGLERRTRSGGKDVVDHASGAHDDIANVVAGVADAVGKPRFHVGRLFDSPGMNESVLDSRRALSLASSNHSSSQGSFI